MKVDENWWVVAKTKHHYILEYGVKPEDNSKPLSDYYVKDIWFKNDECRAELEEKKPL